MSDASKRIQNCVNWLSDIESLTDNVSKQTITKVKTELLSIAKELKELRESRKSINRNDASINNLLDEIHQNEQKSKQQDENEEEEQNIIKSFMPKAFEDIIGSEEELSVQKFVKLFIKRPDIKDTKHNNKEDEDEEEEEEEEDEDEEEEDDEEEEEEYIPPFQTQNVTEAELIKLFQQIPNNCDLANWFINYGANNNNDDLNCNTYNLIYCNILRYTYLYGMNYLINNYSSVDEIAEYYSKYKKYININDKIFDSGSHQSGQTMLHSAISNLTVMDESVVEWLLSLPGIDISIKNKYNETPLELVKEAGKWKLVGALTFVSMSNKMRQKSNEQIDKLNRNKGIIKQWFRFYNVDNKDSNEYKSMIKMTESIKTLINKRLPFSDDLLLLCFNFEMKHNRDDPLKCSIWNCLYHTVNKVLKIPLNRRNWLWFKQYVFQSSIWYQTLTPKKKKYKKKMKKEEEEQETDTDDEQETDTDDEKDDDDEEETDTDGEEKLLYHLLIEMVSKQLEAQVNFLKPHIDKLESKENEDEKDDDSWERLKNYAEFIVTDNPEGLRQDECIDKETGNELLPFPIRPIFSDLQLQKLNPTVLEFDCHNQYDVNGYLSKLVLTAHSLNPIFHWAMNMIFNLEHQTLTNHEDGLKYLQGRVKTLTRSQAKAETDYSHCSYPTTAKVVDFIRCCLVYKNPKDLLNGIDKFVKVVNNAENNKNTPRCPHHSRCDKEMKCCDINVISEKQKSDINNKMKTIWCWHCERDLDSKEHSKIYHCDSDGDKHDFGVNVCIECGQIEMRIRNCLKKILRVKNMFLDNKRENGGNWDLYKYADIKMSVLMEYDGQSMIVEVQYLLDWMLKGKSLGHGLYEIERNKDFIFDVNTIINLGIGDEYNIGNMLRKAVVDGDENKLATLVLNETPIDLINIDDSNEKNALIHIACNNGQKKTLKFLLDTIESDKTKKEFAEFINYQNKYPNEAAIHLCLKAGNYQPDLLKLLLSYDTVNVNAKNKNGETILFECIQSGKGTGKWQQMFDMVINDGRCDWNITNKYNANLLHIACKNCDVDMVKKIWLMRYFDINAKGGYRERTALMNACENTKGGDTGNVEIVKFLLSIVDIDINNVVKCGSTAIDIAIEKGYIAIIEYLYNRKDLNWKAGTRNKVAVACQANIETCKYVMKLWKDIDINSLDIYNDGYRDKEEPVIISVIKKSTEMLKYILSIPGIEADIKDSEGHTAWTKSMTVGKWYSNNLEAVKILYQRKDIDFHRKWNGKNAMDLALENEDKDLIQWLESNGFTKTNT